MREGGRLVGRGAASDHGEGIVRGRERRGEAGSTSRVVGQLPIMVKVR